MPKKIDLTNKRIGRLVVLSQAENIQTPNGRSHVAWECLCDCGNTVVASEDEETGMRMMRDSIEAINRLVDRYLAKTEDVVNKKTGALIDKVSKDFVAASLDYEIVEYRSKR